MRQSHVLRLRRSTWPWQIVTREGLRYSACSDLPGKASRCRPVQEYSGGRIPPSPAPHPQIQRTPFHNDMLPRLRADLDIQPLHWPVYNHIVEYGVVIHIASAFTPLLWVDRHGSFFRAFKGNSADGNRIIITCFNERIHRSII